MGGKAICACVCSVVLLVIAGFVLLIVFIPRTPSQEVAITSANLTRFELTTTPTTSLLFYNISFTMSFRGDAGDYHDMEVDCYYIIEQFDSLKLENFSLDGRRTRLFNLSRSGNSTMNMTSTIIDAFRKSNETGFFDLEIWLKGKWLHQVDQSTYVQTGESGGGYFDHSVTTYDDKLKFQCKLRLQLITSQNTSTPTNFQVVKC